MRNTKKRREVTIQMRGNQDWQQKITSFMLGRNGLDDAARAVFGFAVFAMVLQFLFGLVSAVLATVFSYVSLALFLYVLFRVFSRNQEARARENREWVKMWTPLVVAARRRYSHLKEWKTYHKDFFIVNCETCGQSLRVPKNKGKGKGKSKVRVTCPKCHSVFEKKL